MPLTLGERKESSDPDNLVICMICGEEHVAVGSHVRCHGIDLAQYVEQFPFASTTAPALRRELSERAFERLGLWSDRDGKPVKQRYCVKGHRLSAKTRDANGRCKRCVYSATRRWLKKERQPCACGCGQLPQQRHATYCAGHNPQPNGETHHLAKPKVETTCEYCGKVESVQPSRVSRYCSKSCWSKATWAERRQAA